MGQSPYQPPEQILLVDDDPNIRVDWSLILEDAGYLVLDAQNADEALAIIENDPQKIDVLYTDIDMPGSIDGLTLAQQVHRRWPHIRLVVTSGRAELSDADIPDNGRFVPKPGAPLTVLRAIKTAGR